MTPLGLALLGLSGPAAYAAAVGTWLSLAHRRYASVTGGAGPPAAVHAAEVRRKWALRRWQLVGALPSPDSDRRPVVLVHGFMGRAAHFRGMQRVLHQHGRSTICVDLGWSFQGVASYGPPLAEVLCRHEAVDVVAHSMGGVVLRHVLATQPELRRRVKGVVTLGTPHHGTESARGLPPHLPRDIGDIQPDAPFLRQLPSLADLLPEAALLAVAAQWDVVVFPVHRALPRGMNHLVLPELGHNGLLTASASHHAVVDALAATGSGVQGASGRPG